MTGPMRDVVTGPWERRNQLAGEIVPGALYVDLIGCFRDAIDQIIEREAAR